MQDFNFSIEIYFLSMIKKEIAIYAPRHQARLPDFPQINLGAWRKNSLPFYSLTTVAQNLLLPNNQ
jgi:hypothetical protein